MAKTATNRPNTPFVTKADFQGRRNPDKSAHTSRNDRQSKGER